MLFCRVADADRYYSRCIWYFVLRCPPIVRSTQVMESDENITVAH